MIQMKDEVREQKDVVAPFSDIEQMFEEVEMTGKVTLNIPDPNEDGDAAILQWLKSGWSGE